MGPLHGVVPVWKCPAGTTCCFRCASLILPLRKQYWKVLQVEQKLLVFLASSRKGTNYILCRVLRQNLSGDQQPIQLGFEEQIRKGTEGDLTQDKYSFYEKNFYYKFGQDYNATGDQFSNCFTFELFFSLLNCFRFELDKSNWFRF